MTELGFSVGGGVVDMTNGRPDGQLDGWMDGRKAKSVRMEDMGRKAKSGR